MKITKFKIGNRISSGIVTEKGIADLGDKYDRFSLLIETVFTDPQKVEKQILTAKIIDLESVKLLAPVEPFSKLLALAGNYSEHIKECGLKLGLSDSQKVNTVPRPFLMPPTCVCGDGDEIQWPIYSEQIDYEIEIAIVIGKTAKCVSPEQADDYIAGYCIANDISARSVAFKQNRLQRPWDDFYDWLNGKWADNFLPLGPYITTKDEVDAKKGLKMQLKVNGQVRQDAMTSMMIFPAAEIVSFLSHIMTLSPSDIICTGTPAGVGHATGNYLQQGDIIECYIEKLGKLTNKLGKKPDKFYTPIVV